MSSILIVDDEISNLTAYNRTLKLEFPALDIHLASSETEAEEALIANSYDVVITDLAMSDEKSGMRVLKLAKQKDPLTMVILVTAYADLMDRYEAFENGAFDCIAKSTPNLKTPDEIVAKTKTALFFRQNIMVQIEAQKKVDYLKRYFDPKVFDKVEENSEVLNLKERTVTVAFWDIRGFSKACEILKAHPQAIASFLKEYFQIASDIIFRNNGILDKFIGDGVMAIFGALNESDDEGAEDAKSAAKAALEFKSEFQRLLNKWVGKWNLYVAQSIELGLGCGLHTGKCLVGNVGTDNRDQFTALGADVNLASRIESNTKGIQILVSSTFYLRVSDSFNFTKGDIISNIKNIPGEYQLYELIS